MITSEQTLYLDDNDVINSVHDWINQVLGSDTLYPFPEYHTELPDDLLIEAAGNHPDRDHAATIIAATFATDNEHSEEKRAQLALKSLRGWLFSMAASQVVQKNDLDYDSVLETFHREYK